MNINKSLYIYRILSGMVNSSAVVLFNIAIASILGNVDSFAFYSIFIFTALACKEFYSLGQDRLLFILLTKFKAESNITEEEIYLKFIALLLVFYAIILIVSTLTFQISPHIEKHPILLGICFSPFFAILSISTNLLSISGFPLISRYIVTAIQFLIILPTIYLFHSLYPGQTTFFLIAHIMMFFFMLIGYSSFFISLYQFRIHYINKTPLIGANQKINLFYMAYTGALHFPFLLNHASLDRKKMLEWTKKGVALSLSNFNDNIYIFIIPILATSNISLTLIACLAVAIQLRAYLAKLSLVIRNHFLPMIITSMHEDSHSKIKKKLHAINRITWVTLFILVISLCFATPVIINSYGNEYHPTYLIASLIFSFSFFVQGWAYHRGLMLLKKDLEKYLIRCQLIRFIFIILATLINVFYFQNIYSLVVSIGIISLSCFLAQLLRLYKDTNLFLPFV